MYAGVSVVGSGCSYGRAGTDARTGGSTSLMERQEIERELFAAGASVGSDESA